MGFVVLVCQVVHVSGDHCQLFASVTLSLSLSAFIDHSCWYFVFQNCFLQGLKIRILNATEPIGYLQVSKFVCYFLAKAVVKGSVPRHGFAVTPPNTESRRFCSFPRGLAESAHLLKMCVCPDIWCLEFDRRSFWL